MIKSLRFLALALLANLPLRAEATIEWEISNRFHNFSFLAAGSQRAHEWVRNIARTGSSPPKWAAQLGASGSDASFYATESGAWREYALVPRYAYDMRMLDPPNEVNIDVRRPNSRAQSQCKWSVDGNAVATAECDKIVSLQIPFAKTRLSVTGPGFSESIEAHPRFRLIFGLGDSYAAGEGNPDRPTRWISGDPPWSSAVEPPSIGWNLDLNRVALQVAQDANWHSNRCNRSFWSHQSMAAIQIAAHDPHALVSFVHLACAGAEIVDGLLAPQRGAPGRPEAWCRGYKPSIEVDDLCDVPYSQLRAAVDLACLVDTEPLSADELRKLREPLAELQHGKKESQPDWINELVRCRGERRPIDALFLNIGGNDMGFAGVVSWALLPVKSRLLALSVLSDLMIGLTRKGLGVVCIEGAIDAEGACTDDSETSEERLKQLEPRFQVLALALDLLSPKKTYLVGYPAPTTGEDNQALCNDSANKPYKAKENQWFATRFVIPLFPEYWHLNVTEFENREIDSKVIPQLKGSLSKAAKCHGWRFVDVRDTMQGRGWCSGARKTMPTPREAADWRPYQFGTRMIRTANDAMLTQWAVGAGRNDWLAGTLHPNGEGQAMIADRLYEAWRADQRDSPL